MAASGLTTAYFGYGSGAPTSTLPSGPPVASGEWAVYQNTANGDQWFWNLSGTPGWTKITALSNPMTTAQDLIVGGSSGTPARLAVGANGTVLTVTAGVVGWAAAGGGGSITTATATLGSNVSMTTANTVYDALSVSLAAGTWIVFGMCHVGTTAGDMTVRIWDGTTTAATAQGPRQTNTLSSTIMIVAMVTPGSTTTYKMSVTSDNNSDTIKAQVTTNAVGNTATQLIAIKVA